MDFSYVLLVTYEGAFVIAVFVLSFLFSILAGRQMMINFIFGLYFGLLFTLVSPFSIEATTGQLSNVWLSIGVFALATVAGAVVTGKLMPESFREKRIESLGKKLFLAGAATILVTLYSFHVVPLDELVTMSSPVRSLFASEASFFWWLITPFFLLYFHK